MPTLNRYASSNEKEGFFVRANVGGESPITLQVTPLASRVFKAVGYEDGDSVPTEVVWSMYEFDMLFTLSSVDIESEPPDLDPLETLRQLGLNSKLSDEERQELISYLEAYTGPDAERIEVLRQHLLANLSAESLEAAEGTSGTWFEKFDLLPDSRDETEALLREWTDPDLQRRALRALELCEEFVTWSVRTFTTHPHLAENPISAIRNKEIVYELEPVSTSQELYIADCRGHDQLVSGQVARKATYDFRIERTLFDGTREVGYVNDETIICYESYNGDRGSATVLGYDLDDILPPHHSYFGGTHDKEVWALSLSIEEMRSREDETDGASEKDSAIKDTVEGRLLDFLERRPDLELLIIEDVSNSGNLKAYYRSDLVVITDADQIDVGDKIVVRKPPDGFADNTVIDTALSLESTSVERCRNAFLGQS